MGELDSLVVAMLAAWGIQAAKLSKAKALEWITSNRPDLLRLLAAVVAALSAAGITWAYTGGDGQLVITGLTVENLAMLVWATAKQYALQHGSFKVMFGQKSPAG
jgi:hypothetical protein